jgi:hypothetical protein
MFILLGGILLLSCNSLVKTVQTPISMTPMSAFVSTPVFHPVPKKVYLDPLLPSGFRNQISTNSNIQFIENSVDSQIQLTFSDSPSEMYWVYVLVSPFPTVMDGVSLEDLKKAWSGDFSSTPLMKPILMDAETQAVLTVFWGSPATDGVRILEKDKLETQTWNDQPNWAIIPFEELNPRWKVLDLDGKSPLARSLNVEDYPLTVFMDFKGNEDAIQQLHAVLNADTGERKYTNRNASLLSVVMLTGTTALTRDIGKQMDTKGILYPARDIMDWFDQADIIHISNEVSFMKGCDLRDRIKFCAKPEFLDLLTGIGANVIELTGNHLLDFGIDPFLFTLSQYRQNQISFYGGGNNLEEAGQPLLLLDHGNRIAFLGCNYGFPKEALATYSTAGVNPCSSEWMETTVQSLKEKDYLVIFTFQGMESCTPDPLTAQRGDFFRAAEAGADIVSGSQSHCPQTMTFHGDSFVHYGLGNLFFDQMGFLERREMVDLHYFYEGRHISTQFLTAILEDSAKPRPMTSEERKNLLYQLFEYSLWE